jgi:hypothetical protein
MEAIIMFKFSRDFIIFHLLNLVIVVFILPSLNLHTHLMKITTAT